MKIQMRQGLKADIPTLAAGEFGFCTDTKELYIGSPEGNVLVNTPTGGPILLSDLTIDADKNWQEKAISNPGNVDGVDISAHAANVNAHHSQAHTLASHSTKAHNELTGVTAAQHHAKTTSGEIDHGSVGGLGDDDHTQYLHLNKVAQTLLQSLAVAAGKTIDGVDISEFVKAFNAKARAWRNGLQNISNGTITIVQLGNESYDPGTNFSTATYRLTAPYSGYYDFSGMAIYSKDHPANNLPSPKVYQLFFYKNGATRIDNAGVHSSWGGAVGCVVADIHYLAANDYVDMRVWHNAGVTIELWGEEHSTYMAIHLISKV